jgi:hypothetical protein
VSAAIAAQGLGKRYRRVWALADGTLSVPAGHVVGLIGPNGAGRPKLGLRHFFCMDTRVRPRRGVAEDARPERGGSMLAAAVLDQGEELGWVAAMIACSTSASWSAGLNWMSSVPASAAGACPGGM